MSEPTYDRLPVYNWCTGVVVYGFTASEHELPSSVELPDLGEVTVERNFQIQIERSSDI